MRYLWILLGGLIFQSSLLSAPPVLAPVVPGKIFKFPDDHGAHPNFRIEWWYVTGWLETSTGDPLGFQITFFRLTTQTDKDNPSHFAPHQLIIAHAALSDPAIGKLQHDQKIARSGFDLAYARTGNTDVKLDDWTFLRTMDGHYQADIRADDFTMKLSFTPSQPLMLQGENGFSRKGPKAAQASYYYSEPHLQATGTINRQGKDMSVTGTAWLDREWSSEYLDPDAAGWDWVSTNLDNGSALMAFQIRGKDGSKIWAHAVLRDASGRVQSFTPEQVSFHPVRTWRSARTQAVYPVATRIRTGKIEWQITPLMDDQELDSRDSTRAVYWEGAITLTRDGKSAGRGYMELTGYVQPLTM
ncbi:Predicted secreted hydrolase [Nitrosomonas eutropha]|uniref:lipocalin-like domain-containing protein n=1 Tax=Nitrosomonas TaxID=914 RepID=UPI0008967F6C|nr:MULTISPECIES: lipocalin-like domain-containing protein [Nitrosomonas]MXS80262.1 carotenoid 1,2-hydratase [Nitrosomonas sp. GH22]SDW32856.1 Predicted secreted hydrolase [Nitrosomonas eutropha]